MRSSDFSFKTREPERATAYLNWWWFDFRQDRGVNPPAWHVSSKVDDAQIGGLFYFSIETVHPASEEVVASGLAPASEPVVLGGNREFMLLDPVGYKLDPGPDRIRGWRERVGCLSSWQSRVVPGHHCGGIPAVIARYAAAVDIGQRVSYEVLERGTPVYSAEGERIGSVGHVLAAEDEDVFDGIVVSEHMGSGGDRFADADEVAEIGRQGVLLKLNREACKALPEPSANPAVMRDDPAESRSDALQDKLRRAWDYVSGNY